MNNLHLIYFSKDDNLKTITLNVYENDELIIKVEGIRKVLKNMFYKSLLLEFDDDTKKYFDYCTNRIFSP